MVTVLRAHGLRFIIYTQDHQPAHVHVRGADGEARFNLVDGRLMSNFGLSAADLRRAAAEVAQNRSLLLTAWETIHG